MRQCKGCGATFTKGEEICPFCGTPLVPGAQRPAGKGGQKEERRARREEQRTRRAKGGGFAEAFREGYRNGNPGREKTRQPPRREPPPRGSPPPLRMFEQSRNNDLIAGILAITPLGLIGAHWFYLGNPSRAKWYVLFFWTGIPYIVSIVEGIGFLRKALYSNGKQ